MCVSRVGVDRAGDRHAADHVGRALGERDGEDRLASWCAPARPGAARCCGSEPLSRQAASRRLVPSAPAATTTPFAVMRAAIAPEPRARALGGDRVAVRAVGRAERADVDDGALRHQLHARALREPQVVLDQRVLGAVRAADHAAPAAQAAGAVRAVAAEERIRDGLARRHRGRRRRASWRRSPPTPISSAYSRRKSSAGSSSS